MKYKKGKDSHLGFLEMLSEEEAEGASFLTAELDEATLDIPTIPLLHTMESIASTGYRKCHENKISAN